MGDKNSNQQLMSPTLSGLQRASSPISLSSPTTTSSPTLSAIVARNASHLAQLRALSASSSSTSHTAGLLASVGQESAEQLARAHASANAASGIVSHLRSRNNQLAAAAAQEREDIESLLRAKAAVAAAASANSKAWALQNSRVLQSSLLASGNSGLLTNSLVAGAPSSSLFNRSPWNPTSLYPSEALLTKILRLSAASNSNTSPLATGSPYVSKNVLTASMDSSNGKSSAHHAPTPLYMDCDEDSLSEYQCLIRQQMELFEATPDAAAASVQGRNKQILPGQVGIRCRHCARSNKNSLTAIGSSSAKGSMYFPTKLDRIYQAAQNLSTFHLCDHCPLVPPEIRKRILLLRERKSPAGGGKRYWAEGVHCLGVVEDATQGGLRFKKSTKAKP